MLLCYFLLQMKEELKQQADAACFKARPNTVVHKEPFVPKKDTRSILGMLNIKCLAQGLAADRFKTDTSLLLLFHHGFCLPTSSLVPPIFPTIIDFSLTLSYHLVIFISFGTFSSRYYPFCSCRGFPAVNGAAGQRPAGVWAGSEGEGGAESPDGGETCQRARGAREGRNRQITTRTGICQAL